MEVFCSDLEADDPAPVAWPTAALCWTRSAGGRRRSQREEEGMRAGIRSAFVSFVLLLAGAGCNSPPPPPAVVHGQVNGFEVEYELVPPLSITADASSWTITTEKAEIRVSDGKLRVDGKSFGSVKPKDKISVVGGRVSVNGEDRKPDA
jgi:hypothetical protein